jgi:integrase
LLRENHIVENPYNHEIKMPKYQPRTIDQIPIGKEWERLYDFISKSLDFNPNTDELKKKWTWFNRNKDFKEMLFIMLNTAMRGGEVRILKWKPNDKEYGTPRFPYAHLNRDMKSATIYFKRTLTTNFEFNQKTIDLIAKRYDERNPKDVYVFTNPQTNTHYNDSQFNDNFNRLCEGLGLVDKDTQKSLFSPHSVRHGVISQLLADGHRIEDISKVVARHSKIGTTYDIYGHFQRGKGKSILDTLSKD